MKRNLLFFLMLICSISVFMACSDDDNNVNYPIDEEIAGAYKGTLSVSLGTGEPVLSAQNVYLSKAGNNAIKMELKDFQFATFDVGDIVVDNCILTEKDGTYYFTGEQTLDLTDKGLDKCKVKIVKGEVSGDKLALAITVNTTVPIELTVSVDFSGSKLNGNESSEAKILSFTFDQEEYSTLAEQPMIDEKSGTIIFRMMDGTDAAMVSMKPIITISEKATISPAADEAQDFSNNKVVVYTVIAEDGTVRKYTVSTPTFNPKDGFEVWMKGMSDAEGMGTFYEPAGWTSSNTGAFLLKLFGMTDRLVISQTEDAHSGTYAAHIETIDTKGADMGAIKVPKVTTGSLFLGKFITDTENTLRSSKFGIQFSKRPQALKGYYKYTSGSEFYTCESVETCDIATLDPAKTDECSIKAVLYTTNAYEPDWSDCLTGESGANNIYTSDRVVAIASLESGSKDNWTEFNIPFEYKQSFVSSKKHRMAIVFSSSKEGDKFWGAPGSTLIVDDIELVMSDN